jgi:hypothetical protein
MNTQLISDLPIILYPPPSRLLYVDPMDIARNEFDSRTGRLTLFTYLNTLGPGIPDMISGRFPCL